MSLEPLAISSHKEVITFPTPKPKTEAPRASMEVRSIREPTERCLIVKGGRI
jgi:hypothetical protein